MKKKSRRGGPREGAGRPPLEGGPFDDRFLFECSSKDKAAWQEKADRKGESLSRVVRELLNRWVKRP